MNAILLILILFFPLAGFLINGGIALQQARGRGYVSKSVSTFIACGASLVSFVLSVAVFFVLKNDATLTQIALPKILDWMVAGRLEISFGLVADHLSVLMLLIITGIGTLIHLYSSGYMHEDRAYARFMAYLNLFLFFMLILVLADSLPLLFVGWEGVGLCSYLLIGFWFDEAANARAGKKAFIVNRIGDFAFLVAMMMIAALLKNSPDALNFSVLRENVSLLSGSALMITLCIFAAATGKSAQIPLYIWLPDAMAGPTPVSALIHAATMVTAGIYLVARLSFLFVLSPVTLTVMAVIGCLTAFMAATIALTQNDIKKVLAYSTVSQLGFMVMGLGAGAPVAALFHVMTHAFFKACLFLGAGSVIHSLHHEQDIRKMGGLWGRMPVTAWTFLLSTLAIAGLPPFSGFFSKDEILYMVYAHAPKWVYVLAMITAGLTAFYMTRLFVVVFLGRTRAAHPEKIHESPWMMTLPLLVLALLAVVGGFLGVPHILGEKVGLHNYLGEWLVFLGQKTPHHVDGPLQEGALMLLSAVWALFWVISAWMLYTRYPDWTRGLKMRFAMLYRLLSDKYRIDELYNVVIVRPIRGIADFVLYRTVDVKFIDGLLVHGPADLVRFLGRTMSQVQNGSLGRYVVLLVLATLALMAALLWGGF